MVRTRHMNYSPLVADGDGVKKETLEEKVVTRRNTTISRNDSNGGSHRTVTNGVQHAKHVESESTDSTVYVVFISLLLDLLAFTMILPLLPSLLEHYRQNDGDGGLYGFISERVRHFQKWVGAPDEFNPVLFGGALGSMYSFLQFAASPVIGALSDVYGRKPIMICCLIGISFSYVLWAYSSNFMLFVITRFIGGLSKGNISLSMAIISDVTNHKNRGKAMALVGIAFSLGFIVGPMIGAAFSVFADKSSQSWFFYPAVFALVLSLADLLFIAVCFKETLPKAKRAPGLTLSLSRAISFISISHLFQFKAVHKLSVKDLRKLRKLGAIYFIYLFIYSGLEFTLTFLTHHSFNYTSMQQGKMFFVIGLIMALLQGGIVRRLPSNSNLGAAEFGLWIIPFSFLSMAFSSEKNLSVFGFFNELHFLYAGLFLFAVSTAFVVSCLTTLVSQVGDADQKGIILGVFRSLGALARASGPIVASFIYWSFGAFSTYSIGAVCLLCPVLLLRFSRKSL